MTVTAEPDIERLTARRAEVDAELKSIELDLVDRQEKLVAGKISAQDVVDLEARARALRTAESTLDGRIAELRAEEVRRQKRAERDAKIARLAEIAASLTKMFDQYNRVRENLSKRIDKDVRELGTLHDLMCEARIEFLTQSREMAPGFGSHHVGTRPSAVEAKIEAFYRDLGQARVNLAVLSHSVSMGNWVQDRPISTATVELTAVGPFDQFIDHVVKNDDQRRRAGGKEINLSRLELR